MSFLEGLHSLLSLQLVLLSECHRSLQLVLESLAPLVGLFIDPRQVGDFNLSRPECRSEPLHLSLQLRCLVFKLQVLLFKQSDINVARLCHVLIELSLQFRVSHLSALSFLGFRFGRLDPALELVNLFPQIVNGVEMLLLPLLELSNQVVLQSCLLSLGTVPRGEEDWLEGFVPRGAGLLPLSFLRLREREDSLVRLKLLLKQLLLVNQFLHLLQLSLQIVFRSGGNLHS